MRPSPLLVLHTVSFALFFSASLVALSPAQALMQRLPQPTQATFVLSVLSATAALIEISTSRLLGTVLDRRGRKPVLTAVVAALTTTTACTAWFPSVATICLQKLVGTLSVGFFLLTAQTMVSDMATTTAISAAAAAAAQDSDDALSLRRATGSANLSAAMGQQMAFTGIGFLLGIVGTGQLSEWGHCPSCAECRRSRAPLRGSSIHGDIVETLPAATAMMDT